MSISSETLSFPDALWPPMEPRGRADEVGTGLEGDAACGLHLFEVVERGEVAAGERRIGERPEVLSGLLGGRVLTQDVVVERRSLPRNLAHGPADVALWVVPRRWLWVLLPLGYERLEVLLPRLPLAQAGGGGLGGRRRGAFRIVSPPRPAP